MEPNGWRIGRIGSAPLYLDRFWPIGALLIVGLYFNTLIATRGFALALALAGAVTLGLFVSVLVHEISHGLAGQALGQPPVSYTLTLWGGYTSFKIPSTRPGTMALVAVAGPVANLAFAGILTGVALLLPAAVAAFVWPMVWVNLFMGLFNLAPGLPMDGGQLVHALAWKVTGNRDRGLLNAARAGIFVAAMVGAWGALSFSTNSTTAIWLLVIAFFLFSGANRTMQTARARLAMQRVDLRAHMTPLRQISSDSVLGDVPTTGAVLFEAGVAVALVPPGNFPAGADLSLPARTMARVLAPAAVVTTASGMDAVAAIARAGEVSDVVVLLADGQAWLGQPQALLQALGIRTAR